MSAEEIEDIFLDLAQKFGFQKDSMRNMVCSFFILACHDRCDMLVVAAVLTKVTLRSMIF